jgi:DNA invertase Pin-like site-specific DNA recombinase
MLVAYARTSTVDQTASIQAQQAALKAAGCEKIIIEQASAVGPRPRLEAALDWLRDGDVLVVTKLDRLARSVRDLLKIIERIEAKGASLRILDFAGGIVDTRSATSRLTLNVLASVGEFERDMMLERQQIGIAKAKSDGRYKGRVPTARRQTETITRLRKDGQRPDEIATALKVSRASVFRVLKDAGLTTALTTGRQ